MFEEALQNCGSTRCTSLTPITIGVWGYSGPPTEDCLIENKINCQLKIVGEYGNDVNKKLLMELLLNSLFGILEMQGVTSAHPVWVVQQEGKNRRERGWCDVEEGPSGRWRPAGEGCCHGKTIETVYNKKLPVDGQAKLVVHGHPDAWLHYWIESCPPVSINCSSFFRLEKQLSARISSFSHFGEPLIGGWAGLALRVGCTM